MAHQNGQVLAIVVLAVSLLVALLTIPSTVGSCYLYKHALQPEDNQLQHINIASCVCGVVVIGGAIVVAVIGFLIASGIKGEATQPATGGVNGVNGGSHPPINAPNDQTWEMYNGRRATA